MKKHNPSNGQNNQLMHWWLLVQCGHFHITTDPEGWKFMPLFKWQLEDESH